MMKKIWELDQVNLRYSIIYNIRDGIVEASTHEYLSSELINTEVRCRRATESRLLLLLYVLLKRDWFLIYGSSQSFHVFKLAIFTN